MALFDMAGMLMGGAMNPDLLAQQMAQMGVAVPTPETMAQVQQAASGAAPQNFNNIMNPATQPQQMAMNEDYGGRAPGSSVAGVTAPAVSAPVRVSPMQPPATPPVPPMSAAQSPPVPPVFPPAISPGNLDSLRPAPPPTPAMIPPQTVAPPMPVAPRLGQNPAPPSYGAPTPAPVAPVSPSSPPSGGGIGSDYVAGGGAYPTAAASPTTSPTGVPTQSLSQRLLSSLAGVKAPPAPSAQVPYPPAGPRPSGQITPSATLIDLLMKAQQVAPVAGLGQRLGR